MLISQEIWRSQLLLNKERMSGSKPNIIRHSLCELILNGQAMYTPKNMKPIISSYLKGEIYEEKE